MPRATPAKPRGLADLANVGPAALRDFRALGIRSVAQLARQDAFKLYDRLCRRTRNRNDPCVIDVFMATIAQSRGAAPKPWWKFTAQRKRALARESASI
ncbi:MAG: mitomycin resistance protein [Planctomycetes bacterium]|nr:mitomycin resistance protein [Planctomycetota bacterium]